MIREDFLLNATRSNLFSARLVRDAAALVQTGLKVGDIDLFIALERLKLRAETNLENAVAYADGFVHCTDDSGYLTAYTLGCESRTATLGIRLNMKLTSDEHVTLKSAAQPPVGMRGTLFDCQVMLSAENGVCAGELSRMLAMIASEQTQGKRMTAFSLNAVDCLQTITADAQAVCAQLSAKQQALMTARTEVIERLTRECARVVDLTECIGEEVLSAYAAAAAGGTLKSVMCPLWFDFCYRYSLSVK